MRPLTDSPHRLAWLPRPQDSHPTACPGLPPPQHCSLLPSSSPAADAPEESLYCKGKWGAVLGAGRAGSACQGLVGSGSGLGRRAHESDTGGRRPHHRAVGGGRGSKQEPGPPCTVPTRCRHGRRTAGAQQSAGQPGETPPPLTHGGHPEARRPLPRAPAPWAATPHTRLLRPARC